jgi:Transposase IS66 family
VNSISPIENALTLLQDQRSLFVVNHRRGEQSQPGVAMFLVVPTEESLGEGPAVLARARRPLRRLAEPETEVRRVKVAKRAQVRALVTLNRSREGPKEFLKDYTQVLLADAYGGYNGVVAGNAITRAGCWSHARRKFVEAEKSAPEIARDAVALMDALFAMERQAKDISVSERLELRQKQSVPILAELHRKLLIWKEQLLPKHSMADAVNYTLGQGEALTVFTSDGAVPIDNNVSEREMKRVVLNRKNSLFVGNPRGGRTAAILASLTSSCRRHDMDPHLYFMQLLVNLPTWPARDLDAWLPDRWKQTHIARSAALGIPVPPNP